MTRNAYEQYLPKVFPIGIRVTPEELVVMVKHLMELPNREEGPCVSSFAVTSEAFDDMGLPTLWLSDVSAHYLKAIKVLDMVLSPAEPGAEEAELEGLRQLLKDLEGRIGPPTPELVEQAKELFNNEHEGTG
jgi:hypothetical protein